MAATIPVETDSGTYTGRVHPHNGYYAGDFSGRPVPTGLRRDIMTLRRPAWVEPTASCGQPARTVGAAC